MEGSEDDQIKPARTMELDKSIRIRENSALARLAALKLKSEGAAIVFGRTIHLYGVSRKVFLQHPAWVRHELVHVQQFQKHGFLPFLFKYFVEWAKRGYYNNRFEVEARVAERMGKI